MKQQMLEEEVRNLKKTIEALTAELDQLYEGLNAWPRSLALATLARAEAAEAERDALTAENNRLREALKPFANYAKSLKGWEPTEAVCSETGIDFERVVNAGDFFAARATLKGEQK